MYKWVLSIVSVSIISFIIYLLLPEGKLSKHIKNFFGLIIIFVIIQPIFNLKDDEISIDLDGEGAEIVFQSEYLVYIAEQKIIILSEECNKILNQNGFNNTSVDIKYSVDELGENKIISVTVDLKNAVYVYDARHIDIIEEIIEPIATYLSIEERQVNVVE